MQSTTGILKSNIADILRQEKQELSIFTIKEKLRAPWHHRVSAGPSGRSSPTGSRHARLHLTRTGLLSIYRQRPC